MALPPSLKVSKYFVNYANPRSGQKANCTAMALPLYPFSIYFTDGISQVDRGLQRPRPSCGRSGSGEGFGLENFKERFGKMLHLLTLLLIASSAPQSLMRKSMPFSSY